LSLRTGGDLKNGAGFNLNANGTPDLKCGYQTDGIQEKSGFEPKSMEETNKASMIEKGIRLNCSLSVHTKHINKETFESILECHERKSLPCDFCDFDGSTKEKLKRHMLSEHGKQLEYHCQECS